MYRFERSTFCFCLVFQNPDAMGTKARAAKRVLTNIAGWLPNFVASIRENADPAEYPRREIRAGQPPPSRRAFHRPVPTCAGGHDCRSAVARGPKGTVGGRDDAGGVLGRKSITRRLLAYLLIHCLNSIPQHSYARKFTVRLVGNGVAARRGNPCETVDQRCKLSLGACTLLQVTQLRLDAPLQCQRFRSK